MSCCTDKSELDWKIQRKCYVQKEIPQLPIEDFVFVTENDSL